MHNFRIKISKLSCTRKTKNTEDFVPFLDTFTCGKCKRVFTSIMYLARHIKRVCPDMSQRKWKCSKCSKAFRHPFGLQQHMFTHTGERPHKCSQCAKAFYSANDLKRYLISQLKKIYISRVYLCLAFF